MTAVTPIVRDGMIGVPLTETTLREFLWRVGHAIATYTDEAALSLIGLAESKPEKQAEWFARAAAITDAGNVYTWMTREEAYTLAALLITCTAQVTDDEPRPVFRLCGLCKRLRPDTRWGADGTRCPDCYDHEMEIHRDHTS